MSKIASWLLILLALVPVVSLPNLIVPGVNGKVLVYRGVVFVVSLLFFLIFIKGSKDLFERMKLVVRNPIFVIITIGVSALGISTLFAYDPYRAFFGDMARGEGFITLATLYVLYVYISFLFTKRQWVIFFKLTTCSLVVVFGYQMLQFAQGMTRSSSLLANPIQLSAWYLFSLFGGIYLYSQKEILKNRVQRLFPEWGISAIILSILGIFFAQTRGAFLGVVVALVMCGLILIYLGKSKNVGTYSARKIGVLISGSIIALVLLFFTTKSASVWQRIPGLDRIAQTTFQNSGSRFIFLEISAKGFAASTPQQKIIGWGWDNYEYFWTRNYTPIVYSYDTAVADRAHNKLVDVLIMTGIAGLAIYLCLWFVYFKQSMRIMKTNTMLGLGVIFFGISYFVQNLFSFDTPVTSFSFYIVLAVMTTYFYE